MAREIPDYTGAGRKVTLSYHGRDPYFEPEISIIREEDPDLVLNIALSADQIPASTYDPNRRTLDMLYKPFEGMRIMLMVFHEVKAPKELEAIDIFDSD